MTILIILTAFVAVYGTVDMLRQLFLKQKDKHKDND